MLFCTNYSNLVLHAATDIDQQTEGESRIYQWRSMALNQEETGPSNGNRDTASLLGDQTWSKRDQADENEVNDVSTRRRKLTEKGRACIATLLKERREKINGRMMRKCSIIEDLLLSNKNRIAVEEEFLLNIHEEYSQVLIDDERAGEDDWFDDLDNKVCAFKRKILNWLGSTETERSSSKGSARSCESGRSKSSGSSKKSQSSRAKELEEKARIAELMAEAEYIEQRQYAENQLEMLKIQQEIAKSKARAEVYGQHDTKSVDDRSQLSDDKIDLAQRCQSRNIAQPSLNYHRSNALQKQNDVICDIVHDRGHLRTHGVKGQQHGNNLRRNKDLNVAEMMCKLMNQQSAPDFLHTAFA